MELGLALVGLAGVVIGAGLSFLFTMYVERQKWRREDAIRLRDRSVESALRCLTAIQDSNIRSGRGKPEHVKAACPALHLALEAEVPFLVDEEIAKRVNACQEAARVFGWPTNEFKGYNHALASVRIRQIVTVTRSSLEAYSAGRALSVWEELPERASAMAWIFGPREDSEVE